MLELRWLTKSWEELNNDQYVKKSERVLQYRSEQGPQGTSWWSDWKEVEEEFKDV